MEEQAAQAATALSGGGEWQAQYKDLAKQMKRKKVPSENKILPMPLNNRRPARPPPPPPSILR
jgi:hypothetical protein